MKRIQRKTFHQQYSESDCSSSGGKKASSQEETNANSGGAQIGSDFKLDEEINALTEPNVDFQASLHAVKQQQARLERTI